mmetsp:Transcript_7952/g.18763  ORF Transcript_7952/g.18763 Transcript_7952/m.18763 type:complete len:506 (-) Transcript_7952:32-1549(-)
MRVTLGACFFAGVAAQRPAEISLFTAIQNTVAREQAVDEQVAKESASDRSHKQADGAIPAQVSLFTAIQNTLAREQAVDEQPAAKRGTGNFLQQRDEDDDQETEDDDDGDDDDMAAEAADDLEDDGESADPLDGTDEADLGTDDADNESHIDDHDGGDDPMDDDTRADDLLDLDEADGADKEAPASAESSGGDDVDDEKLAAVVGKMLDGKAGATKAQSAQPHEDIGDDELAAMAGRMLDGKANKADQAKLLTHMLGGDDGDVGAGSDQADDVRAVSPENAEDAGSIAAVAREFDHAEASTTMTPALQHAHREFARELGRIQPDGELGDDDATRALATGVAVDTLHTMRSKASKAAQEARREQEPAPQASAEEAGEATATADAGKDADTSLSESGHAGKGSYHHDPAMAKAAKEMPAHIAVPEDPHFEAALEAAVAMEGKKPLKAPVEHREAEQASLKQREADESHVPKEAAPAQEEEVGTDKDEDLDSSWNDQEGGHLTAFSQQ